MIFKNVHNDKTDEYFIQIIPLCVGPISSAEGKKTCPWVNSSSEHPEHGLQFLLSHSLTPYVEETSMMELTVEAMNDNYFQRTTKIFYLRDISKFDSIQKNQGKKLVVAI